MGHTGFKTASHCEDYSLDLAVSDTSGPIPPGLSVSMVLWLSKLGPVTVWSILRSICGRIRVNLLGLWLFR